MLDIVKSFREKALSSQRSALSQGNWILKEAVAEIQMLSADFVVCGPNFATA
jgi:hypothetical protein